MFILATILHFFNPDRPGYILLRIWSDALACHTAIKLF